MIWNAFAAPLFSQHPTDSEASTARTGCVATLVKFLHRSESMYTPDFLALLNKIGRVQERGPNYREYVEWPRVAETNY